MNRFVALPLEERRTACEQAGAVTGLPAVSVEKDFGVCWALRELFSLPGYAEGLTFKGGTSLSKGWGLIRRFSEDVDLVIDRRRLGCGEDRSPETAHSSKERKRREALDSLKPGGLRLVPAPEQLPAWQRDYTEMRDMFFGPAPPFDRNLDRVGAFARLVNGGEECVS